MLTNASYSCSHTSIFQNVMGSKHSRRLGSQTVRQHVRLICLEQLYIDSQQKSWEKQMTMMATFSSLNPSLSCSCSCCCCYAAETVYLEDTSRNLDSLVSCLLHTTFLSVTMQSSHLRHQLNVFSVPEENNDTTTQWAVRWNCRKAAAETVADNCWVLTVITQMRTVTDNGHWPMNWHWMGKDYHRIIDLIWVLIRSDTHSKNWTEVKTWFCKQEQYVCPLFIDAAKYSKKIKIL